MLYNCHIIFPFLYKYEIPLLSINNTLPIDQRKVCNIVLLTYYCGIIAILLANKHFTFRSLYTYQFIFFIISHFVSANELAGFISPQLILSGGSLVGVATEEELVTAIHQGESQNRTLGCFPEGVGK